MTENEQADEALQVAQAMLDVAAMIAKEARENLGGLDVVSVGSVFARAIQGVQCFHQSDDVDLLFGRPLVQVFAPSWR